MRKIDRLTVKYHGRIVGLISLTPDDKRLAFEYDPAWISEGFSISPLELPLRPGLFLANPTPLYGNFGISRTVCRMGMVVISFIRRCFVRGLMTEPLRPSRG